MSRIGATAALVFTLSVAAPAFGQDGPASSLSTQAVQNRKHLNKHEFGFQVGVLPLDAFTKGVTVSLSYSYHFDELWAWEMLQGAYSFGLETHLVDDLKALDIRPTPFERVEWYVSSVALYKPVYWKGTLLNRGLLYGELYLSAGGGFARMTRSSRPMLEVGLGIRLYASELISFRIDMREMLLFSDKDIQNELWIGLGISI